MRRHRLLLFASLLVIVVMGITCFPKVALAATSIKEYPVPTTDSLPCSITAGPDGNLWFAEGSADIIGKITTAGKVTEYPVPGDGGPSFITAGPDGNLWYTRYGDYKIGKITPSGKVTEYPVPTCYPVSITAGPDGNLWFTEMEDTANKIGKITTSGKVTNYPLPTADSYPWGITAGPDGNLWFAEDDNRIGKITPSGKITEYPVPGVGHPCFITAGSDGNLWFTNYSSGIVCKITTSGRLTKYLGAGGGPWDITSGPDGNLWFAEQDGNRIGRITTSGSMIHYTVPTSGSCPCGITTGPDGNLWFTEKTGNKIGRLIPPPKPLITNLSPSSGARGSAISVYGSNFGDLQGSSYVKFGSTKVSTYTSWSNYQIVVKEPSSMPGNVPVVVHTDDGTSNAKTFTVYSSTWYLAEGSTDCGFDTYISIQNPNTTAVTAQITYMTGSGPVLAPDVNIPPMSQATVNPRDILGNLDFSTQVTCAEGKTIAVDRTMTWTGPGAASPEAHSSIGVTSPAKTWYLPEGSSKWGFECWLLIQNPNAGTANCTITYMIEGKGPVTVKKKVPANSRKTFFMADDIGSADASIKVVSNRQVIPERAMYRNNRREGHDSIGVTTSANDYYLAEGTSAWGFTTYVLVQNPNKSPTDVTVTYMTPTGPKSQTPFTMDANSRKTIRVNDVLPNTDFSTHVQGTKPIIAERAMYWGAGTPLGEACHDSVGMASARASFYLPDGQTSEGKETWTLVQNPNSIPVTVEITYMTPSGAGNVVFQDAIPANSRKTYNMADKGIGGRAAVMVTSKTASKKIMVERAMYWNSRGAGTDTIGGYSD